MANNVKVEGAGFGVDTNVVTMITGEEEISLGMLSKEETASKILDQILKMKSVSGRILPGVGKKETQEICNLTTEQNR